MKFDFNSRTIQIIFWVIIIVLWYYLYMRVEPLHNSCWTHRRNECGVDKFKVDPHEGDTNADLLRRLEGYTNLPHEQVFWRRSLLNAILIAAILLMFYHKRVLIPILQFFVAVVIIFIAFYFHNSYYTMHFDMRSNIYAQATINELRYKLGISERPSAPDFVHNK